jgi:hypothetical protein
MFSSRSSSRKQLPSAVAVPAGRAWLLGVGVVAVLGGGCAGKQTGGELGEDCYRDEDCKVGLVCVATPAPSGPRVCSSDVTGLASSVPGPPPDAGTPVDDAAAPGAAGSP